MSLKILIILIIIISLGVGIFFAYQKFISSESIFSDICRKVTTANERNYCLAMVNNNDKFCQKIDIAGEKKVCLAIVHKDPAYCRDIREPEPKEMCFYELAEATGNINYCDEAEDKEHCYFNLVANLYWVSQSRQIKTEYCNKFSSESPERDTCFALKEKDISFCGEENIACLTFFEQDLSFCEDIKDEDKLKCIRDRAMIAGDPAICEKATDLEVRDECYFGYVSHFDPDVSLCEKVKNEQLRNMCYVEGSIDLAEGKEIKKE